MLALALAVGATSALEPLLTLAAAAGLALLAAVVFRPGALLLLLVAAFPWDGLLAFPSETVSAIKLLGALLLAGYLLRAAANDDRLRFPSNLAAVLVFAIVTLVSLAASADPGEGVNKSLRYLLFATFLFVLVQLLRSHKQIMAVVRVLVVSSTAAAIVGLVAFLGGASERVSGPIEEANDFAFLLAATLPFAVGLAVEDRRWRVAWTAAGGVIALALLGTLSRGTLVGVAALAVWALATGRVRIGGALAMTGVVASVLALALAFWQPLIDERLTQKNQIADANVASRKAYWSAAARMAADHPLLGVGPGRYSVMAEDYVRDDPIGIERPVAHNSYLEVLAEGGALALLAFLAFVVASWRLAVAARRRALAADDLAGARLASAIQAGLVVTIVAACFLSVQIAAPLWLLGGLAAAAAGAGGPAAAVPAAPPRRRALLGA